LLARGDALCLRQSLPEFGPGVDCAPQRAPNRLEIVGIPGRRLPFLPVIRPVRPASRAGGLPAPRRRGRGSARL